MDLAWQLQNLPQDSSGLRERTRAMLDLVDGTMSTVRRIATSLRPTVLDDLGLEAAVEWQVRDFRERTGYDCSLSLTVGDLDPTSARDTAVFRILQEALTNVARHAEARRVSVSLSRDAHSLFLTVEDDGKGIRPRNGRVGMGITGMRERADALGGEIRLDEGEMGGTLVHLRMPLSVESF